MTQTFHSKIGSSKVASNIKVYKQGVTIRLTHEQALENKLMHWEFVAAYTNPAYRRKVVKRTWVPVDEMALAKYKELEEALTAIEDDLYELGAERENGGYWEPPTGHYEYEYGETHDEWVARCAQLDAAK